MTSSMITGDQRWSSKRRGGMTVLGKVAAPKPLNLPSQRLENHGLDPNVEIVPKGTLSWGRPSSGSSNAWATSALSPSTDGGSSSPSHLAGRPSTGGGTQPSTAGSEKAHDSNVSAWGPNSRPSSASGVVASNHTSLTSLRPRSADTRPGSSHLSRFAEPSPDGSGAGGAIASSDRMGVRDGFSLSSGDFPTLGSEKDESTRKLVPEDASHVRPGSSSGGVKPMSDSVEITHDDARDLDFKGHSWRKDCPPFVDDGPRPNMERWHADPHLYQNPNIGPPHYDSWRGAPPVNAPGGVWYRGPTGPPPYGGPVPPGSFPMEPFPYYRPQVPAPGLPNSHPIPPPGAGLHGHHPRNGDMYRPHMPETYMRPGPPMRPGFFHGPVPYDGYYRPPMGFCNPDERDLPFMGMAAGPPVFNRPTNSQTSDPNSSHPRSREGRGPEQVDPGHLHDPRGNYKVLVKPTDSWDQNDEGKWGHRTTPDGSNREKGILSRPSLQENAWGDDYKKDESADCGESTAKNVPSRSRDNRFHSSNPANSKVSGKIANVDEPSTWPATENLAFSRDHSLIQKIEGLNAKARASGGRQDAFHREDVQVVNAGAHQPVAENSAEVVLERHYPTVVLVPVSRDSNVVAIEKNGETVMTAGPRRAVHGAQSRGNRHGKGNFDGQETHGWGRKAQSHSAQAIGSGLTSNDHLEDKNPVIHSEMRQANIQMKGDGGSALSGFDAGDTQQAKMSEIAKQRAIQRDIEEKERTREQRAKARAKLEELNKRSASQFVEVPSQKEIVSSHYAGPQKPDDSRDQHDLEAVSNAGSSSGFSNKSAQVNEKGSSKVVDSAATRRPAVTVNKGNAQQDFVSSQNLSATPNINLEDAAGNRTEPQVRDVSKHKRAGYKLRQNVPPEKNLCQNLAADSKTDVLKDHKGENANQEATVKEQSEIPLASVPQKRRNNKSGKNKHKAEDSTSAVSSTISLPNNSNLTQTDLESVEDNASNVRAKPTSPQLLADAQESSQSSENHSSVIREEVHGRVNNASKHQHSRKSRNSHRLSEKAQSNDAAVWAPKVEVTEQTSHKAAEPLVSSAIGENMAQSSSKTKRAEIERYVPKPVAKELAQLGSIQQHPSLLVDHSANDETGGREKPSQVSESVAKARAVTEGKTRHARPQGSWRQRVSADSNPTQASQDSSAGRTSKNIQPSSGQTVISNEPRRMGPANNPAELSSKGPEVSVFDGWNTVNDSNSNSSAGPFTGVKDNLPLGKGKKHPFKGQKGSGNHHSSEHKDSNAGLTDSHHVSEINHMEKAESLKENRVDRSTSHWQPKPQVYVAHNQQANRSRGTQNHIVEDSKGLKPVIGSDSGEHSQSWYNQSAAKDPRPGSGEKTMRDMEHLESKREKRGPQGRPHFPSQGPEAEVEPVLSGATDRRYEQRPSSGYRKNSNYGGRGNRIHDSHGDWSSTAQETKQHYPSSNREKHRQNSHYEYQRVGPYDNSDTGTHIENQRGGARFQERGHSRRGRGNFYGRQNGNE